jgi:hypothetical protein
MVFLDSKYGSQICLVPLNIISKTRNLLDVNKRKHYFMSLSVSATKLVLLLDSHTYYGLHTLKVFPSSKFQFVGSLTLSVLKMGSRINNKLLSFKLFFFRDANQNYLLIEFVVVNSLA